MRLSNFLTTSRNVRIAADQAKHVRLGIMKIHQISCKNLRKIFIFSIFFIIRTWVPILVTSKLKLKFKISRFEPESLYYLVSTTTCYDYNVFKKINIHTSWYFDTVIFH